MVSKKGQYQIPFDKEGNQLNYDCDYYYGHKLVDNYEFEDVLTYVGYGKGRSSVVFTFVRTTGPTVSVFISDMNVWIPRMVNGTIEGTFTFRKNGANFGCCLVTKDLT